MPNTVQSNLETSRVKCPTPSCVELIKKYWKQYHAVFALTSLSRKPGIFPEATVHCCRCGGFGDDDGDIWIHECARCKKLVGPGELRGNFVPHLCKSCDELLVAGELRSGRVCSRCNQPYSRCTC